MAHVVQHGIPMVFGWGRDVPARWITKQLLPRRAKIHHVEFKPDRLAKLIYRLGPDCPDMACLLEDCGDHWKARPDLHLAAKSDFSFNREIGETREK